MTATENRLRESLSAAAATAVDVRPLTLPVRRRLRIPMLLVAATVTMAAVGAGFVWAGQLDPRTTTAVQAPPTPRFQPQMLISVFLCKEHDPFPQCKGSKADKVKIAEALWSRPDVEWLSYESAAKSYKNFREQNKDNSVVLTTIKVKDMPEAFRVVPEQDADWNAIIADLKTLPGVSNVIDQRCPGLAEKC
ncbi:permease-like cell division protein FtsX [Streptosporangium subroseum]|uniref:permease-like cell division protein FtsX n=1 Tax=Streptosporangium subroseum TaxID=106412 RepID=UPI003088A008|nr:permease-like cell division protein FtsX [Streptosporangium subroseum]